MLLKKTQKTAPDVCMQRHHVISCKILHLARCGTAERLRRKPRFSAATAGGAYTHAEPSHAIWCAVDRKRTGRRGTVAEERPDLIQEWDAEQNGVQTPHNVTAGSPYRAAWRCGKRCEHCGNAHEGWRAAVVDRCKLQSTGCPFCRCVLQLTTLCTSCHQSCAAAWRISSP